MKRILILLLLLLPVAAYAHVGSKDVFETVHAGPYTLYVTVRMPNVIPGVAQVEIRSLDETGAVSAIRITPLPVTGEGSKHPPAADTMVQALGDKALFTGAVWMMSSGAWQVRVEATGSAGTQVATVPVLAVPVSTLHMQKGMGLVLALLGLFLVVTMAGVIAASVREARLPPGVEPSDSRRRRGWVATGVSLSLMLLMVWGGGRWWNVEAADYAGHIFAPAPTHATLAGNQLDLKVDKVVLKAERGNRLNSDYLPDHGQLMHLYAIREPEMDAAFHLHPALVAAGDFRMMLPAMPPGHYKLYGDVVHANGLPETLLAQVDIPAGMHGTALAPDDAEALPPGLLEGLLGARYKLPDGYTMVWEKASTLTSSTAYSFHFKLLDPAGQPAKNMQPYLGMAGHAAFVKTDGSVFAHTHPEGSAAMADVMLANESLGGSMAAEEPGRISADVMFPYGFPTRGRYRIFIQMKHDQTVETGVFDAEVK